jgi:hypothetical protein
VSFRWKQVALVVFTFASALPGCAPRRNTPPEQAPQAEWSLTVTNRHSLDVSVYVTYDGQRAHVGVVPAISAMTFLLPPNMIAPGRTVRLEANAIGSPRRVTTEALPVRAGQHVEWILENGLDQSNVSVW